MTVLGDAMTDAIYASAVAEDAVYVDASGAETAVRVVPQRLADDIMIAADVGVRGVLQQFAIRKSSLNHRPTQGELVEYNGARYCVARLADDLTEQEWLIDVRA